jgi:hypothetical protein
LGLLMGVIASPLLFIYAHQGITLRSNKNEWTQRMHSSSAWTCAIPRLFEKHSCYKHHSHSFNAKTIRNHLEEWLKEWLKTKPTKLFLWNPFH